MSAASVPATPDVSPSPASRRSRSCVRRHKFASFVLALLAFVLVLRLTWGWYTARQLAAAWEKVRAQGHPTMPSDLELPPLADGENAWTRYAQAIGAIRKDVDSPRNSQLDYPNYPPHGPQWEQLARASEEKNGGAFPLARAARQHAHGRLPRQRNPLDISPRLYDARRLSNTLADGAQYAHLRGDDAEAVERLLDGLHLGRTVRQEPRLVPQLVAFGIDALTAHAAQQIVPTLRLGPSDGGTPATPAQARALIAALLDEKEPREWFVRGMCADRVVLLEQLESYWGEIYALRPLADRTALRHLSVYSVVIDAGSQSNYAKARPLLQSLPAPVERTSSLGSMFGGTPPPRKVPRYSRWFDVIGAEGLGRVVDTYHQCSAERRATAFIIAARLYRNDHGRWPDDAASLVPVYLDALPADPFRDDGGPLGYVVLRRALPDGGDRPLVYIDAGEPGQEFIDTEPMYDWLSSRPDRKPGEPIRKIRQYRDVSLWTPKTRRFDAFQRSGSEAVDEDPDEPNAPGDDGKDDGGDDDPAED